MCVTWAISTRSALTRATPRGLPSCPLSRELFTSAGGTTGPLGRPVFLGGSVRAPAAVVSGAPGAPVRTVTICAAQGQRDPGSTGFTSPTRMPSA